MLDTLAMAEQLSGEYKNVFEKADMYSMGNNDRDEKLMDLYDILTEAQHEEKAIEKIVGEDIEQFCKDFFEEEKNTIGNILVRIYDVVKVIFIFSLSDFFLAEEGNMWSIEADVFPFICGCIAGGVLSVIFKYWLQPMIFKSRKINPLIHSVIILALFVVSIVASVFLVGDREIPVNTLALVLITGGYVICYLILRTIWRYKKHGKIFWIHKEEKRIEKEFNEEMDEKSQRQIVTKTLEKRFQRINRRNRKKGRSELTYQEFAEKIRKEVERSKKWFVLYTIFISLIVAVPTLEIMITSAILEGVVVGVIMGVFEFVMWRWVYKTMKSTDKAKLAVIEQWKEEEVECENGVPN